LVPDPVASSLTSCHLAFHLDCSPRSRGSRGGCAVGWLVENKNPCLVLPGPATPSRAMPSQASRHRDLAPPSPDYEPNNFNVSPIGKHEVAFVTFASIFLTADLCENIAI